jgi:hypothetical protein
MKHSNYSGIDVGPGEEKNLIHTPQPNPPAPYWFVCIRFDANHTQQSQPTKWRVSRSIFYIKNPSQFLDLSHFRQYLLSPVQHKVNGFHWTTGRNGFKSVWKKKIKWLSNKWLNLLYT